MKLALVGAGEYLPAVAPLDNFLMSHLPDPVRVVCLPTAAGTEGAERIRYWMQAGVNHFRELGATATAVPIIDAATANDPDHADTIRQANFIYLSGGKPGHLQQSLQGSLAWQAIQAVLTGGGLLAGCSAGAMIMGEKFFGFPGWKQGFGLVPGTAVIPHFDEIPSAMLSPVRLFANNETTIVGIDGSTALVRSGDQYAVSGSGGVTIWTKDEKTRYTQGPLPTAVQQRFLR